MAKIEYEESDVEREERDKKSDDEPIIEPGQD